MLVHICSCTHCTWKVFLHYEFASGILGLWLICKRIHTACKQKLFVRCVFVCVPSANRYLHRCNHTAYSWTAFLQYGKAYASSDEQLYSKSRHICYSHGVWYYGWSWVQNTLFCFSGVVNGGLLSINCRPIDPQQSFRLTEGQSPISKMNFSHIV